MTIDHLTKGGQGPHRPPFHHWCLVFLKGLLLDPATFAAKIGRSSESTKSTWIVRKKPPIRTLRLSAICLSLGLFFLYLGQPGSHRVAGG